MITFKDGKVDVDALHLYAMWLEKRLFDERDRCANIAMEHARYWSQQASSETATARTNEAELIAAEIRSGQ